MNVGSGETQKARYFKEQRLIFENLKQKARVKWAIEGDENNGFFHAVAKERKNINSLKGLLIYESWVEDPVIIKVAVLEHFKNQFKELVSD